MNDFRRLEQLAKQYKALYPKGTRIELQMMGSDPRPIEPGTRGTVDHVDDLGTIHCTFDNGRRLGIIPEEDSFRKLTQDEIRAEVIAFDDLQTLGSMSAAREKGRIRSEGKEYVMKDGDIVNFLFNV